MQAQAVLKQNGRPDVIMELIDAINSGNLDTSRLTFQVIYETLQFLNSPDIRGVRYSQMTRDFWKLVMTKCGASVIRIMSGWKTMGSALTAVNREWEGSKASIVLAVPSVKVLLAHRTDNNLQNFLPPGIHTELITSISEEKGNEGKAFILAFDGRLVQYNTGEVDLAGLEIEQPTAKQRHEAEEMERDLCKTAKSLLERFSPEELDTNLQSMRQIITLLSRHMANLREMKKKKQYALNMALGTVKGDWKKSKYSRLISHLKAVSHQVEAVMQVNEEAREQLGRACASLAGVQHLWTDVPIVNMPQQSNYRKLQEYPPEVEKNEDTLYWQQRGRNWFQLRDSVPVTGSKLHTALGLSTLKEARQIFQSKKNGTPLPEPTEKAKEAMKKGVQHEPNAVATFCGKFLPALFPNWEFREVGCKVVSIGDGTHIVDSPDGATHTMSSHLHSPVMAAIEIKHTTTDLPKSARHYNIIQCLAHCEALDADVCYLLYHTERSSVMYKVSHSVGIWSNVCRHACDIYGPQGHPPKQVLKDLREQVKSSAAGVQLVAEFRSVYAANIGSFVRQEDSPYFCKPSMPENTADTDRCVTDAIASTDKALDSILEYQELFKPMAKEVLEFIASDTDRWWTTDSVYGSPVAYFLKSASFPENQANKVVEAVLQECHDHNVYVPVTSGDGAFEYMVARSVNGRPNTRLSFQKHLWKEVRKMDKRNLTTIITMLTEDAWSPVSGCAKVKCERNDHGLSVERSNKYPSPSTATWAFKSKPAATVSEETSHDDWYNMFITSLPEEVKDSFENFCSDNPDLFEKLRSSNTSGLSHTDDSVDMTHAVGQFMEDQSKAMETETLDAVSLATVPDTNTRGTVPGTVTSGDDMPVNIVPYASTVTQGTVADTNTRGTVTDTNTRGTVPGTVTSGDDMPANIVPYASTVTQGTVADTNTRGTVTDTNTRGTVPGTVTSGDDMPANIVPYASTVTQGTVTGSVTLQGTVTDTSTQETVTGPVGTSCLTDNTVRDVQAQLLQIRPGKWQGKDVSVVKDTLADDELLNKCTVAELKEILKTIKKFAHGTVKLSVKKAQIIEQIRAISTGLAVNFRQERVRQPLPLKDLCTKTVKQSAVVPLAAAFASFVGGNCRQEWEKTRSCSCLQICLEKDTPQEVNMVLDCFYCPPVSNRGFMQAFVVDPHHVRTNIRGSVLRDQVEGVELRALQEVASSGKTPLTPVMINESLDMQSKSMCDILFSNDVAKELQRLGHATTAEFITLMDGWYRANDVAGIPAAERVRLRLAMREWLLRGVNFDIYPPPGRYIRGLFFSTWEAALAQIDLSIQLYGMIPSGNYNVRAMGTLVAEQYFGDQARRTHEGKNIPSCQKLGHIQAHMVEEMRMRMKPEEARGFPLRMTGSRPVYPSQSTDIVLAPETDNPQQWEAPCRLQAVTVKDHPFDMASRAKQRKKTPKSFSTKLTAPMKGQTGVRQYHRTDLSKILPHDRMGLQ
ncbi:uncharacterized protein LOC118411598 [Branchiostoma floridae]|uniref:Uncharacterized protein LOC118411598 n=1 Tax=Branchiostoma floridae TaxID=7739 RepID=A0A9J7MK58_BRAFL|nr:uncharacterized protein LOC118411598 [Branchiostoma floridae]XP_035669937.1 uncharacterized protein LOC118411598 [Branchiostoma floridae]XP_035669938.1 uncharacterized protein LOC118411598 [Branchiostoma floridae]